MRWPRGWCASLALVWWVSVFTACVPAFAAKPGAKPKKPPLTSDQRAAQSVLKSLSLRDRIAQLIVGSCYGDAPSRKSAEFEKYRHWVRDLHIGGLIVNNRVVYGIVRNAEPHAMAVFLNQMQKMSKVPLIVGADFERGASMRVSAGAAFPYNMAFSAARDVEASRFEGEVTAREARAVGVQWVFAPVADVNNNPENPVINIRSFGENPDEVSEHVSAFIDGAHSDPKNRVILSAKHFPGHGDTNVDSHFGLPRLDASRERIEQIELKPFAAAMAHGIDSIMSAHMAVPAIEPQEIPATASPKILTGLLREQLGFNGIVVTDAMDMQGYAAQFNSGEGSVRALEAGADVLLMPANPEQAIRAVAAAVGSGRLTRQRIDESVLRVLTAKVHVGIMKKKLVDPDEISDVLDSPEEEQRAREISEHAVTLVRNEHDLLPLAAAGQYCVVITTGARISQFGQRTIAEFRKRSPSSRFTIVDPSMPEKAIADEVGDTGQCSAMIVTVFGTGAPMRGDLPAYLEKLAAGPVPMVLVAVGSPYVLGNFQGAMALLATFSTTPPSEEAAVRALFGEIPISGRLPVTIPGVAKYGDGIQLPARTNSPSH
jgi:beta-N-acetylhexosaminidase